ncbi:MAG: pre-toxin TG domain-containing protein [Saprospiraceae bacterium]|nr:pre-toxin TG domain-containing protein [Saprospiraceae bacterium]
MASDKIGRTLETVVGFVPGAGQILDIAEAATGREMFTDEPLPGGQRLMALIPGKIEKFGGAANAIVKNADDVSEIKKVKNPYGSKGKSDHQAKVDELAEMARAENPGMDVVTERKIQVDGSRRRPDVQVVDPSTGTTTRIYEADRQPNSTRNKMREAEYDRLGIPYRTHKVGGN